MNKFPNLPVQILQDGDSLLWDGWQERNGKNLKRWRDTCQSPKKIKPHKEVGTREIVEAGNELVKRAKLRGPAIVRPGELHLEILETGEAVAVDLRRGRIAMLDHPNPQRFVARLPSEELLFFLKFPWGADTLNITACTYVMRPFYWRWLTYFIHLLYKDRESRGLTLFHPVAGAIVRTLRGRLIRFKDQGVHFNAAKIVRFLKRKLTEIGFPLVTRFDRFIVFLKFGPWFRSQGKFPSFQTRKELYRYLNTQLGDAAIDFLEFGVYQGASLKEWTHLNQNAESRFFGFDSFQGLPEDWELLTKTIRKGEYSTGGIPPDMEDTRTLFFKGNFQDTLLSFLSTYQSDKQKIVHLDADLYSSTLFVLTVLDRVLVPGSILIFDEFTSMDEFRAFLDYTAAYRRKFHFLATAGFNHAQAAFKML